MEEYLSDADRQVTHKRLGRACNTINRLMLSAIPKRHIVCRHQFISYIRFILGLCIIFFLIFAVSF